MIAIINYGGGNLGSMSNAVARIGYEAVITSTPEDVIRSIPS